MANLKTFLRCESRTNTARRGQCRRKAAVKMTHLYFDFEDRHLRILDISHLCKRCGLDWWLQSRKRKVLQEWQRV